VKVWSFQGPLAFRSQATPGLLRLLRGALESKHERAAFSSVLCPFLCLISVLPLNTPISLPK
jgi:hypothetical protein